MSLKQTLACFPLTQRGAGTPLKTDAKRNLLIYARERTVVIRDIVPTGGQPIQARAESQTRARLAAAGPPATREDTTLLLTSRFWRSAWLCSSPEAFSPPLRLLTRHRPAAFPGAAVHAAHVYGDGGGDGAKRLLDGHR